MDSATVCGSVIPFLSFHFLFLLLILPHMHTHKSAPFLRVGPQLDYSVTPDGWLGYTDPVVRPWHRMSVSAPRRPSSASSGSTTKCITRMTTGAHSKDAVSSRGQMYGSENRSLKTCSQTWWVKGGKFSRQ